MGEIRVKVELENGIDSGLWKIGKIKREEIRKYEVDAMVDTGSVMLFLPQDVVEVLGLPILRKAVIRYADERKDERPVAGPVSMKIINREMNCDCIVGPPFSEPLIGQIILEELDLIPDCQMQVLKPRYDTYASIKVKIGGK